MLVFFTNSSLIEFATTSVTAGVPQGPIVCLTFFLLYTPNDVNCNISICGDDSTLYSKYDEESNLWQ